MKNFFLLSLIFSTLISSYEVQGQNPTVGLQYQTADAFDGYTLFSPQNNNMVYLINNCGEKVHEWEFTENPGLTVYLLENSNLLRAGKDAITIRDWDNNLVWSFSMSNLDLNQHHDIEPLPNGNVLCVVGDRYTKDEIISMGRDSLMIENVLRLDKIIELQPIGIDSADIVWQWKFADHLIQDFDSTKINYGVVEDYPELLDLNFDNQQYNDFIHLNSIDYNAELDQIMITARHLSEIFIIDHSTTSEEAASHSGGNSGLGGDFLWRWGNPQVYRQGGAADQKLFLPHDAKWVDSEDSNDGNISVFNNGGDGTETFSSVHLIAPEFIGGEYPIIDSIFQPIGFDWSFTPVIFGDTIYQTKMSGIQWLSNGNFLVTETGMGRVSEFNSSNELLWSYVNPNGDDLFMQFEQPIGNQIYRAEKYPLDYIGFSGVQLISLGLIEDENSVSDSCVNGLGFLETEKDNIEIINPVESGAIYFNGDVKEAEILIADIMGRIVYYQSSFSGNKIIINLNQGVYVMNLKDISKTKRFKFICK